jgi:DNA mismatch endonuclease (patch repair protein)
MVDTLTQEERSKRMSQIKSRDTRPELALRCSLHRLGLRYRLCDKRLPGKPDIVMVRYRFAIFVHGCFWHRHDGCKVANRPKSNTAFWDAKFLKNTERDAAVRNALEHLGWTVWVAWECELNSSDKAAMVATRIQNAILSN